MIGFNRQGERAGVGEIGLSILFGVLHSFLLSAICVVGLTAAFYFSDFSIEDEYLAYVMIFIMFVSILTSGFYAGYKLKAKGLAIGCVIGAVYALVSIGVGAEMTQSLGGWPLLASKFILSSLAGALGGIIGVNV